LKTDWERYVHETNPLGKSLEAYIVQNERWKYLNIAWGSGEKILEVGIGSALGVIYLATLGKEVVGVDCYPKVITLAKQRAKQFGVEPSFFLADARNLPFKDWSFDVVLHEGLLEHFDYEDRMSILREHLRVAEHIVVDVPTVKSWGGLPGPYGERLLTEDAWLAEWDAFDVKTVWRRTFVSIGAVLKKA